MRDKTGRDNWRKQLSWLGMVLVISGVLAGCTARVSTGSQTMEKAATPPATQQESDVVSAQPQWFGCKTDVDCTVEAGLCGSKQAVNHGFVIQFQQYREKMEQSIRCMAPEEQSTEDAKCFRGRCALKSQIEEVKKREQKY